MPKVLIITYYWPPAGGPGVQRLIKWVRLLPQYGWTPLILTVNQGDYPALDPGLESQIPANLKVFRTSTLEPFGIYKKIIGQKKEDTIPTYVLSCDDRDSAGQKFSRWIRANLFIPDARIGWNPFLKRVGRRVIRREKPDLILSSSPPHSLQLGAGKLARMFNLPWIADLRDPWSEAFWEKDLNRIVPANRLNRAFEKKVLKKAQAVITVSPGLVNMFEKIASNRYQVIHNGFMEMNAPALPSTRFTILYIGTLSKFQDPEPLLVALQNLPATFQKKIHLRFIGRVFESHRERIEQITQIYSTFESYKPYKSMMNDARTAALLLKIQAQSGYPDKSIGAKMYDYLAMRKPILVVGGKGGVIDDMVSGTGSGVVFAREDITGILNFLKEKIISLQHNPVITLPENDALNRFKTAENVHRLSNLMHEVLNNA